MPTGPRFVFAAEMPQRLQRADFVDRLANGSLVQAVLKAGLEADLEMGRNDFLHHTERIRIAFDYGRVVLEIEAASTRGGRPDARKNPL